MTHNTLQTNDMHQDAGAPMVMSHPRSESGNALSRCRLSRAPLVRCTQAGNCGCDPTFLNPSAHADGTDLTARQAALKIKYNLFLNPILSRREGVQRHKEVRELTTVAQLVLDEQQTLERHFLAEPEIEAKVMRANVHA
jgi:hypothetical protein